MKTTRYNFEKTVQSATENNTQWLKDEFKAILEADKNYTRKADYIGFSILSIDDKVNSIDEEIKELQSLKKNLKIAKEIVLTTGALVFKEYDVEKVEGAGISSITINKPTIKHKINITPTNEKLLIDSGFYKKVIDMDAVTNAYEYDNYTDLIEKSCKIDKITTTTQAKLRINKHRKSVNNLSLATEEILQLKAS
jgi:hypothetical protein